VAQGQTIALSAGRDTKRVSLDGVLIPLQRSLFDRFLGFWCPDGTPSRWGSTSCSSRADRCRFTIS
jgi:hypothetical protein